MRSNKKEKLRREKNRIKRNEKLVLQKERAKLLKDISIEIFNNELEIIESFNGPDLIDNEEAMSRLIKSIKYDKLTKSLTEKETYIVYECIYHLNRYGFISHDEPLNSITNKDYIGKFLNI